MTLLDVIKDAGDASNKNKEGISHNQRHNSLLYLPQEKISIKKPRSILIKAFKLGAIVHKTLLRQLQKALEVLNRTRKWSNLGPRSMRNLLFRRGQKYLADKEAMRRFSVPSNIQKGYVEFRYSTIYCRKNLNEPEKFKQMLPSLSKATVSAKAFLELDSGKIRYFHLMLQIVQQASNSFSLKVSHVASDYSKTFFIILNDDQSKRWVSMCDPKMQRTEFQVNLEALMTRVMRQYMPKPRDPIYTIVTYNQGSAKADKAVGYLLYHFMDKKVRSKSIVGRTFLNIKSISEGTLIMHNLFILAKEHYRSLEKMVCKLVFTSNNLIPDSPVRNVARQRRGRQRGESRIQQVPVAYDMFKDEVLQINNTFEHLQSQRTRRPEYERSYNSYKLLETEFNPSALLGSQIYRMDQQKIVEMGDLLLSTSSMVDLNFHLATFVCRLKLKFFLVSLKIEPPDSLEKWRDKTYRPKDLNLPGTWVDKIGLKVQVYDMLLHRATSESQDMILRNLLSNFHVSRLESFFRGIACGGLSLNILQELRNFTFENLDVVGDSLVWGYGKTVEVTEERSQEQAALVNDHGRLTYSLIHPYPSREPGDYSKCQLKIAPYTFSRRKKSIFENGEEVQASDLMPWGTRYKRLQLLRGEDLYFYTLVDLGGYKINLRFNYLGDTNSEIIHISAHNVDTNETFQTIVRDEQTVERLINLLMTQKEARSHNNQFIKVSMNFFFNLSQTLSGKNLLIEDIYRSRASALRQESQEQNKWNITCRVNTVFLKNYFLNKTLFFATTHKTLGKVYVECAFFYSFKLPKRQAIALLAISQISKRLNSWHFVINALDLEQYFECDIFQIVNNNPDIISIFSKVVSKVVLVTTRTFSKPAVPLKAVRRRTNKNYTEILHNEFDQRNLLKDNKVEVKGYLEKKVYHSEIVAKCVTKFRNQFWIVTIVKNLLLNRFDIECYMPLTRRKFQCKMTEYDFTFLKANAVTELTGKAPSIIQKINDASTNFQNFEFLLRQKLKEGSHFSFDFEDSTVKNQIQVKDSKTNQTELRDSDPVQFTQTYSNIKFWLDVLSQAKLTVKHNDLLIEIVTFKSVLKEHIWHSLCANGDLQFELMIDFDSDLHQDNSSKRFEVFKQINISNLSSYSFLIKIIFINQGQQHHVDKVNLTQLYKLYRLLLLDKLTKASRLMEFSKIKKNHRAIPTEKPHSRHKEDLASDANGAQQGHIETVHREDQERFISLRLSDLIDLARILEVNVMDSVKERYQDVIDSELTYFNEEKILSKQMIYQDRYERRMKLNSKLCLEIMADPHYKEYNDILISRHIFTVRPQKILVILYNKKSRLDFNSVGEVSFTIYNAGSSKVQETKKSLKEIETQVPHLLTLIENKKFTEAGRRLFALYKNSLLAQEYLKPAR